MKKLTIEEMESIAKRRGGKCLSDTYVNAHRKLLWECAAGHQWEARPNSIKIGTWCKACARELTKGTIEEMQRIAKKNSGKCLSDTYVNNQTKLLWECAEGHQWEAIPNSIKSGTWCTHCARMDRKGKMSSRN